MNRMEIRSRVRAIMSAKVDEYGMVSPVEVLIDLGYLSKDDYENWRFGRVQYLEKVCKVNLSKLSTIMKEIRTATSDHSLTASWTDYRKWGKGVRIRLCFSKSVIEPIERAYATHYISHAVLTRIKEQAASM